MVKCDLHCHSTMSDGSMPVEQIVRYAARIGLSCIAITDHDTLAGVERAVQAGENLGVKVIPGVEMTTKDEKTGRPVHVLCYLPRHPDKLQHFLNHTLQTRRDSKLEMIRKVKTLYPVTEELVFYYCGESQSIYEPHIMMALADMGYTNAPMGELMTQLISSKGSCYAPNPFYPETFEALEQIRRAGGIGCIAHPGQFDSLEVTEEAARRGLIRSVELDHPRNPEPVRARIREIAQKYHLIMTGGSDFHGYYAKSPHPLGSFGCDEGTVERLLNLQTI